MAMTRTLAPCLGLGLSLGLGLGCATPTPSSAPEQALPEIHVEPVPLSPTAPLSEAAPVVDEVLELADPTCGRSLEDVREDFHAHICHPHIHELEIDADAEQLGPELVAFIDELVREAERDEPDAGIEPSVFLEGGPGVALVRDALLERGLTCEQVYTWPKNASDHVTLRYVCTLCCLL